MSGSLPNITTFKIPVPVTINTMYAGLFAAVFIVAAILHWREWKCLFYSIFYLIALPSGYLFLIIYAIANIDSMSWGTREQSKDKGTVGGHTYFVKQLKDAWGVLLCRCWCCKRKDEEQEQIPKGNCNYKMGCFTL